MNYLDLFSGIGGFHQGLLEAGFQFDWVGHSEIDKYANQIYEKHFSESEALGDVKAINPSKLPKINIITFGFPCQDLSVAGQRKGLRGERSGLFFEAVRIIRASTPEIFIFENVEGLLTSDNRKAFIQVLGEIADLGLYECEWQLLNTSWFLPQNRERVYFIGHLRGASRPKVFPIAENDFGFDERTNETTNIRSLCGGGHSGGHHSGMSLLKIGVINKDAQGQRVYSPEGNSCQLTAQGGGWGAKTGLYAVLIPDREKKRQNGRRMKNDVEPAFTLTGQDIHGVSDGQNIRRLTPLECERLQGFPDGWTEGISDTQRYKCLGNAVSVPVVKTVGERLNR